MKVSPKVPTSLIVGDSFAARLDANRVSKGTKNVINIAKGGYKIPDAIESLDTFHKDLADKETIIDQVFISIGTNDICHSRREGVGKFKSELFKLIRRIKELFPRAKIFFQLLIPLPITRENESYVARNLTYVAYNLTVCFLMYVSTRKCICLMFLECFCLGFIETLAFSPRDTEIFILRSKSSISLLGNISREYIAKTLTRLVTTK